MFDVAFVAHLHIEASGRGYLRFSSVDVESLEEYLAAESDNEVEELLQVSLLRSCPRSHIVTPGAPTNLKRFLAALASCNCAEALPEDSSVCGTEIINQQERIPSHPWQ